jgi:hypothetical protein
MQTIPLPDHPSSPDVKDAELHPHRVVQMMKGSNVMLTEGSYSCKLSQYLIPICRFVCLRTSHIFDGVNIAKETASFQLCDIHDRMLMDMIKSEDDLRDVCNVCLFCIITFNGIYRQAMQERDGWYSAHAFERIKTVLRHKFFSLLEGHIPTDEECEALLVVDPTSNKATTVRSKKLRPGKHNMAKGALRPEDAAVRSFAGLWLSMVLN